MMTHEHITLHEIGDRLSELVTPFYKERFPTRDKTPEFRKTLTSAELTNLLHGLHELLVQIRITERDESEEEEL